MPLPNLPNLNLPTHIKLVLALLENHLFCPIFIRKSLFSHYPTIRGKMLEKKSSADPTKIYRVGVQQTNIILRMAWVGGGVFIFISIDFF